MFKAKPGDVVLVWDKDIIGKLIRFAVNIIFAIKSPCNHVEMAISENSDISAEARGVVYQNRAKRMEKAKKYVIARNRRLTEEDQKELIAQAILFRGKKYDYYLHILWYFRFTIVFAPLVWLISRIFAWWLKRKEGETYMCSELVSELYGKIGMSFGLEDHSFVTPSDIYQVIKSCSDWEIVHIYEERK